MRRSKLFAVSLRAGAQRLYAIVTPAYKDNGTEAPRNSAAHDVAQNSTTPDPESYSGSGGAALI